MRIVFFRTQDQGPRTQGQPRAPGAPLSRPSPLLHSSLRPLDSGAALPDSIRQAQPDRGRKNAFTMIELVAALSLFVVILGILMAILDNATSLWSDSRATETEHATAETIVHVVASDLYQAVTDNAGPTNKNIRAPEYPSFILDTPSHSVQPESGEVTLLLGFARHTAFHSTEPDNVGSNNDRLSLDAVFYTWYQNAVFRHVLPLYNDFNEPQPLGTLLHKLRSSVETANAHDQIIEALRDPTKKPDAKGQYSVLAQRVIPTILATMPEALVRQPDSPRMISGSDNRQMGSGLRLAPVYERLTADALPDQIDLALHLFDEKDWDAYQRLLKSSSSDVEFAFRAGSLGTLISRRITLPQAGGSRLP